MEELPSGKAINSIEWRYWISLLTYKWPYQVHFSMRTLSDVSGIDFSHLHTQFSRLVQLALRICGGAAVRIRFTLVVEIEFRYPIYRLSVYKLAKDKES